MTTRLDVDVKNAPLRDLIASLDVLDTPAVGTVFRLNYSTLGSGDVLTDEAGARGVDELMDLVFPGADPNNPRHKNRVADVDHLMGHKLSGMTCLSRTTKESSRARKNFATASELQ